MGLLGSKGFEESIKDAVDEVQDNSVEEPDSDEETPEMDEEAEAGEQIESLREQIKRLSSAQQEIYDRNRQIAEKLDGIKGSLDDSEMEERVRELEDELETVEADDANIEKALKRQKGLRDDFIDLQEKLEGLEAHFEALPNDYEFEDVVEQFNEKMDVLEETVPALESSMDEIEELHEKDLVTVDELEDIESEMAAEDRLEEVDGVVQGLEDAIEDVRKELEAAEVEEKIDRFELQDHIENLQSHMTGEWRVERIESTIGHLQNAIEETEHQLRETMIEEKVDESELETRIEELKDHVTDLRSIKTDIRNLAAGQEILESQFENRIEELRDRLMEDTTSITSTKADDTDLENVAQRLGELYAGLEQEMVDIRESNARIEKEMDEKGLEELDERIDGLEEMLGDVAVEEKVDSEELEEELEKLRDELGVEIMSVESRLREDLAEMSQIRGVWDTLELVDERHQETASKMESLLQKHTRIGDEVGKMQEELFRLHDRLERAEVDEKIDRAELENRLEEARDEIAIQLMEELEGLRTDFATKSDLRNMEDNLEADGGGSTDIDRQKLKKELREEIQDDLPAGDGGDVSREEFENLQDDVQEVSDLMVELAKKIDE